MRTRELKKVEGDGNTCVGCFYYRDEKQKCPPEALIACRVNGDCVFVLGDPQEDTP